MDPAAQGAGPARQPPAAGREPDPAPSPLLLIPHEGGQRFRPGDTAQRILQRWISEGCRIDRGTPACVRLEVSPARQTLSWPWQDQALTTRATTPTAAVGT